MVGRCDWARLRQVLPGLRRPWLSAVLPPGADEQADASEPVPSGLRPEEAHAFVVARITELLAAVLALPATEIAPDRRLDEYGVDSLMAAELLLRVRTRFAVDIPPMELLHGGTVDDLARNVLARLGLRPPGRPAD